MGLFDRLYPPDHPVHEALKKPYVPPEISEETRARFRAEDEAKKVAEKKADADDALWDTTVNLRERAAWRDWYRLPLAFLSLHLRLLAILSPLIFVAWWFSR